VKKAKMIRSEPDQPLCSQNAGTDNKRNLLMLTLKNEKQKADNLTVFVGGACDPFYIWWAQKAK
jgi:hypothetical protein